MSTVMPTFFQALCPLSFTSHNIHYITPITRHCHANILPSTGQENKSSKKKKRKKEKEKKKKEKKKKKRISYSASHLIFHCF